MKFNIPRTALPIIFGLIVGGTFLVTQQSKTTEQANTMIQSSQLLASTITNPSTGESIDVFEIDVVHVNETGAPLAIGSIVEFKISADFTALETNEIQIFSRIDPTLKIISTSTNYGEYENNVWSFPVTAGQLYENETVTLTIFAEVTDFACGGSLIQSATLMNQEYMDRSLANDSVEMSIVSECPAPDSLIDVSVVKDAVIDAVSADSVKVGDEVTYTVTVTNEDLIGYQHDGCNGVSEDGISWALSCNDSGAYHSPTVKNVIIEDLLPAGVTYESHSIETYDATSTYDPTTGIWQVGTLPSFPWVADLPGTDPNAITAEDLVGTLTVVGTLNSCGEHINIADISEASLTAEGQTDINLNNNSYSLPVNVLLECETETDGDDTEDTTEEEETDGVDAGEDDTEDTTEEEETTDEDDTTGDEETDDVDAGGDDTDDTTEEEDDTEDTTGEPETPVTPTQNEPTLVGPVITNMPPASLRPSGGGQSNARDYDWFLDRGFVFGGGSALHNGNYRPSSGIEKYSLFKPLGSYEPIRMGYVWQPPLQEMYMIDVPQEVAMLEVIPQMGQLENVYSNVYQLDNPFTNISATHPYYNALLALYQDDILLNTEIDAEALIESNMVETLVRRATNEEVSIAEESTSEDIVKVLLHMFDAIDSQYFAETETVDEAYTEMLINRGLAPYEVITGWGAQNNMTIGQFAEVLYRLRIMQENGTDRYYERVTMSIPSKGITDVKVGRTALNNTAAWQFDVQEQPGFIETKNFRGEQKMVFIGHSSGQDDTFKVFEEEVFPGEKISIDKAGNTENYVITARTKVDENNLDALEYLSAQSDFVIITCEFDPTGQFTERWLLAAEKE